MSITLNDEAENLMILPPIEESLKDKIILLRANKAQMPMDTSERAGRERFWAALLAELPAFVQFLLDYAIPPELVCQRFGVTHYHHPELLEAIDGMSPETKLLAIIDTELFGGCQIHGPAQRNNWKRRSASPNWDTKHASCLTGVMPRERIWADWPNDTPNGLRTKRRPC